jgi:hypothetical protein
VRPPEDPSYSSPSDLTTRYDDPLLGGPPTTELVNTADPYGVIVPPMPQQRGRHASTQQSSLRDALATACVAALLVILVAVAVMAVDVMLKVLHG